MITTISSLQELQLGFPVHALWPEHSDAEAELMVVSNRSETALPHRHISNITSPELIEFTPQEPNGVGILVIPGGGYQFVSIDNEGIEVGKRLSSLGYHVFCLNYRLPQRQSDLADIESIVDAKKAVSVMKSKAWHCRDFGVLGFSAGGHLAAWLSTDTVLDSVTLDFSCLMYPVVSMRTDLTHSGSRQVLQQALLKPEQIDYLSIENRVSSGMPPTLIMHAEDDDSVVVGNSLLLHKTLSERHVDSTLQLFSRGGHGFGARVSEETDAKLWVEVLDHWILSVKRRRK